jgi:hypothetical protein
MLEVREKRGKSEKRQRKCICFNVCAETTPVQEGTD